MDITRFEPKKSTWSVPVEMTFSGLIEVEAYTAAEAVNQIYKTFRDHDKGAALDTALTDMFLIDYPETDGWIVITDQVQQVRSSLVVHLDENGEVIK